ncbi:hypothetical protein ON010_g10644 [Phytophthora cinnamomi]|nr:hypothetical protein ON010_g10644 [Phytophthora cinnamomi]
MATKRLNQLQTTASVKSKCVALHFCALLDAARVDVILANDSWNWPSSRRRHQQAGPHGDARAHEPYHDRANEQQHWANLLGPQERTILELQNERSREAEAHHRGARAANDAENHVDTGTEDGQKQRQQHQTARHSHMARQRVLRVGEKHHVNCEAARENVQGEGHSHRERDGGAADSDQCVVQREAQ